MECTTIGIDLAKTVFEVAVSEEPGRVCERRRLSRSKFLPYLAQAPSATVLLEACGSAHHWARRIEGLGHTVRLLPAAQVRPYRQGQKTDRADAKALLEAFRNDQIRPVPVKSVDQQALASLHRVRSGWMATRTARLNMVRGLLREFGLFITKGAANVVPQARGYVEDAESCLPASVRLALAEACDEIREIEGRVKALERELESISRPVELVKRLRTIPGIGLLIATALVAVIGDARRFRSGRHMASYIGLTPREFSSGSKQRLGRISKRGDTYLRMLLVHGARSVLRSAGRTETPDNLQSWAKRMEQRQGRKRATVALANRLARIAWAVWVRDEVYRDVNRSS